MPSFEKHCKDCKRILGKDFAEVHTWLDELFEYFGPRHRKFRHNEMGVEKVRKKWGDKSAEAAIIHINADMGFVPTKEQGGMWENEL